jgi:hypothetical protein
MWVETLLVPFLSGEQLLSEHVDARPHHLLKTNEDTSWGAQMNLVCT